MQTIQRNQASLILWIVVFFWFAQYVYIPYQTTYLLLAHISSNVVGAIIGAYGISQLALRLPVGILADLSSNHKLFIILGTFFAGTASFFRILLPDETGFLIANILSGTASATWISFMVLYMSFFNKEAQTRATSKIIMANNTGILLAFVTSTFLYDTVGMMVICAFSLGAGLIACLLAFFLRTTKPTNQPKVSVMELLQVLKDKNLLLYSCLALVQQGVQMATTMSFTNQVIQELGAKNMEIGFSSIIYMISAVFFAKLASTKFLELLTKKQWIYSSFLLLGIYCLLVPQSSSVLMVCFLQLIPGMGTGILFSLLTSEALQSIPQQKRSTAMGFFQAVYAVGMTTFPIISGSVYEHVSMKAAFIFLAGTCFIAFIISLVFSRKKARKSHKRNVS
ncbi:MULTISPECIES: MFS transporter [unclassified Niallia]|uniref:MFS transporter n=1 Tax=Niallia TaxID=2837506 RepID=UPI001EDC4EDF|nr:MULTISPECIES: MFS transporter [unclassified Niallia]MDL0436108.1 MFS transporter [Niallia sp. SS-2023]UPO86152.1 MFS transporter [Niallia sp. Man26]